MRFPRCCYAVAQTAQSVFLCCCWALQRYLECLVVCVNFKRKSHYEKLCVKTADEQTSIPEQNYSTSWIVVYLTEI